MSRPKLDNQLQMKLYDAMMTIHVILPMISNAKRIELRELLLDGYCTNCGNSLTNSTSYNCKDSNTNKGVTN